MLFKVSTQRESCQGPVRSSISVRLAPRRRSPGGGHGGTQIEQDDVNLAERGALPIAQVDGELLTDSLVVTKRLRGDERRGVIPKELHDCVTERDEMKTTPSM